jgi:hypothetical protein
VKPTIANPTFSMTSDRLLFESGAGKRLLPDSYACDVLISAFNLTERLRRTFKRIRANQKYWIVHNEYGFTDSELPTDAPLLQSPSLSEAEFVIDALSALGTLPPSTRLCIDVTGFMRPHLMFLMNFLKTMNFLKFDLVYTEPSQYQRKADTVFASDVVEVRQVNGFEGTHAADNRDDILIVGAGYDHDLVGHVIANKSRARLVQLLSLPSLSADMYQESLLRLHRVSDAPARVPEEQLAYASANDPYVTYIVLAETLGRISARSSGVNRNLYLSPLATKPQAVGFALYYLRHLVGKPASIIFPFAKRYSKETSTGVGRAWLYELDFSYGPT